MIKEIMKVQETSQAVSEDSSTEAVVDSEDSVIASLEAVTISEESTINVVVESPKAISTSVRYSLANAVILHIVKTGRVRLSVSGDDKENDDISNYSNGKLFCDGDEDEDVTKTQTVHKGFLSPKGKKTIFLTPDVKLGNGVHWHIDEYGKITYLLY
jgi:hypothetical protein